MKMIAKLQWSAYVILLIMYCINFYLMYQRQAFYRSIMQDIAPNQWVQKQKCWPMDGRTHFDEEYGFYGDKQRLEGGMNNKTSPHVEDNCVTYWEKIN